MKSELLFSKDVNYFVQCATLRSFSKAGKVLNVSQSTLSVAIKRLEEELGHTLFERGRGQGDIRLTMEAEALLQYLTSQKEVLRNSLGVKLGKSAPIRIASIQYFSRKYLMPTLSKHEVFSRAQVFHVRSGKAIEAIKEGSVDLAFVVAHARPLRDEKYCIELKEEDVGIIGAKTRFSHIEKVKDLDELKNEPWIVGDRVYEDWPNCLAHMERAYYVEDHFSARFLVLDGYGIAPFQLDYFTDAELKKLTVSRVLIPSNGMKLYALVSKHSKSEARNHCLSLIKEIKGSL
ncbi:MAG: LysR family transcriptional regulator [Bdellovibrio sp.]|nr:LysR family transcriptional regulator [Bdellovibrio sp.]